MSFAGKYVDLKDTIEGFKGILEGKYDSLPEQVCNLHLLHKLSAPSSWKFIAFYARVKEQCIQAAGPFP